MFPNGLKCFGNGPKWCQMLANGAKWIFIKFSWFFSCILEDHHWIFSPEEFLIKEEKIPQKTLLIKKLLNRFFLLFRYFVLLLFFNIVQKGLKSSKISKNVSKLTKIVQYGSKASNNFRKPPKTFKSLQKPPKASKSLKKPQNTSKTKSL